MQKEFAFRSDKKSGAVKVLYTVKARPKGVCAIDEISETENWSDSCVLMNIYSSKFNEKKENIDKKWKNSL